MNKDCERVGAERRRRLELNEKMLALARLVPNLTKGDRASIVGEAAEYIFELQRLIHELKQLLAAKNTETSCSNNIIAKEEDEDEDDDDHDQGTTKSTIICQLCYKYGHLASHCQFRFLETFNNPYYAAAAANTANINNNSLCISSLARNSS